MLFFSVYEEVFDHFLTIPDHFGRFPKTSEDYRSFPGYFHFPLLLRNNDVILRFFVGTTLQSE